jgi:hypothetical protein
VLGDAEASLGALLAPSRGAGGVNARCCGRAGTLASACAVGSSDKGVPRAAPGDASALAAGEVRTVATGRVAGARPVVGWSTPTGRPLVSPGFGRMATVRTRFGVAAPLDCADGVAGAGEAAVGVWLFTVVF